MIERLRKLIAAYDDGKVTRNEVEHLLLGWCLDDAVKEVRDGKPYGLVMAGVVRPGCEDKVDRMQVTVRPLQIWFTPIGQEPP